MRKLFVLAAVMLACTAGGVVVATSSAAGKVKVPHLTGRRLDVAEDILRSKGLRYKEVGGGVFGIIVKSNWRVCSTSPAAGRAVARRTVVRLYVGRNC